jgi:hypothetical protein
MRYDQPVHPFLLHDFPSRRFLLLACAHAIFIKKAIITAMRQSGLARAQDMAFFVSFCLLDLVYMLFPVLSSYIFA